MFSKYRVDISYVSHPPNYVQIRGYFKVYFPVGKFTEDTQMMCKGQKPRWLHTAQYG